MSTVYPAGSRERAAFSASSRGDIGRTYRVALRHSRLCALAAHQRACRHRRRAAVHGRRANYMPPIGGVAAAGGTRQARDQGHQDHHAAAAAHRIYRQFPRPTNSPPMPAAQDITKPDLMELHQTSCQDPNAGQEHGQMSAISGIYNMKTEMLTLADDIHSSPRPAMRRV